MTTQTANQQQSKYDMADLMRQAEDRNVEMTFVLLPSMNPSAPIYMKIGGNRMRINKLNSWRPFRQVTFTDKEGRGVTLRLKLNTDTLVLEEQIKKGIPANQKYTEGERNSVLFRYNVLTTKTPIVKKFLLMNPQFDGFEGDRPEDISACYQLLDERKERKSANSELKRRAKAINIITGIEDKEVAQELLMLLYGSQAPIAADLEDGQNILADAINDDDELLQKVLDFEQGVPTVDEKTKVLVLKLMANGTISLDHIENQVGLKAGQKYIPVRTISSDIQQEKRVELFVEFLNSKDGEALLNDLKERAEVRAFDQPQSQTKSSAQSNVIPASQTATGIQSNNPDDEEEDDDDLLDDEDDDLIDDGNGLNDGYINNSDLSGGISSQAGTSQDGTNNTQEGTGNQSTTDQGSNSPAATSLNAENKAGGNQGNQKTSNQNSGNKKNNGKGSGKKS
jgi:hypothetical protein